MNHWPPQDKPVLTARGELGTGLNYTAKGRRRRLLFAVAISLHTEGKKKYNNPKIRKENNKQIPAATLK